MTRLLHSSHSAHTDTTDTTAHADDTPHRYVPQALAVLRVAFGFTFLWAFADKLFGLGAATKSADAWINGGSPTEGYLKFGSKGPFKDFYGSIAGDQWVNVLFMASLLAIGVALTLGIGMRLAAIGGAVLYLMMWTVYLPPDNNPFLDDHILGAISVVVLGLALAGDTWGLGRRWSKVEAVRAYPVLR